MSDETGSPAGGEAFTSVELPADAPETFSNAREAADYFTSLKASAAEKKEKPAESAPDATADQSPSQEDDAARPEEDATGETQGDDPAAEPLLDLPRSWTKEQAEHWKALPRATQEYLREQDSKASAEVRRVQNETAEARKAARAEREQAETVRHQFESKLKTTLDILEREQLREFPDIRSMADLERMANDAARLASENPFEALQITTRLKAFDTHQQKMQAVAWELKQADSRKSEEQQKQTVERKTREHSLLLEKAPELSDPKKLAAAQNAVVKLLRDFGYSDDQLSELASNPMIDDHRIQLALWNAAKYSEVKNVALVAAAKPLPPVQRPGTSKPSGSVASEKIQALEAKFNRTGNLKDAQALYAAQIEAQTRRAS